MRCTLFILFFLLFGCKNAQDPLFGYIEGEYIYISSQVAGTLLNLAVTRGQQVKAQQLLYQLDLEPERAARDSAQTVVTQMQAQMEFAKSQLSRQEKLFLKQLSDEATLEQAQTDYQVKQQQLLQMQKQLAQAQWDLEQKTRHSPTDGKVFDTFFRAGEQVGQNQPVLALLTPEHIKALFYLPQTLLSQIKLGQTIHFQCDGCQKTPAKISYISPQAEYTPPIIYSKDTRYKLVYLIRADIDKNIAYQFHPGQPIDIFLHDHHH